MKAIKITPFKLGNVLVVSIECDCGRCSLTDKSTGANNFDHEIEVGSSKVKELECKGCGARYKLYSDAGSAHVTQTKK